MFVAHLNYLSLIFTLSKNVCLTCFWCVESFWMQSRYLAPGGPNCKLCMLFHSWKLSNRPNVLNASKQDNRCWKTKSSSYKAQTLWPLGCVCNNNLCGFTRYLILPFVHYPWLQSWHKIMHKTTNHQVGDRYWSPPQSNVFGTRSPITTQSHADVG